MGRAAQSIVVEVRRQFREIKGLMEGKAEADYETCVDICTKASLREMILPTVLAIVTPVVVGLILGYNGVIGMLGRFHIHRLFDGSLYVKCRRCMGQCQEIY